MVVAEVDASAGEPLIREFIAEVIKGASRIGGEDKKYREDLTKIQDGVYAFCFWKGVVAFLAALAESKSNNESNESFELPRIPFYQELQ